MKRFLAGLITLLLLAVPASATVALLGAGPGTSCTPQVTPGGGLYTSDDLVTGWTTTRATKTTNTLSGFPSCVTNGAKLTEDSTASATHLTAHTITASILVQAYTVTVYTTQVNGTRNLLVTLQNSSFTNNASITINPSTCATVQGPTVSAGWSSVSGSATAQSNSWCKITLTVTTIVDTGFTLQLNMRSGTSSSYSGDGTSAIGLWGVDVR